MLCTRLDPEDTLKTFFDFSVPVNLWEETDSHVAMIQFNKWSNGSLNYGSFEDPLVHSD